jgi:hypothetical protein
VGLTRAEGKANTVVRVDLGTGTTEALSLDTSYAHDLEIRTIADPRVQAGDSDQDLDFDQRDLVHVQVVGKYLTGQPATWGEGDWDGAPGGSPGDPPEGDGVFNQLDIIAAVKSETYLTGPYAVMQASASFDASLAELALVHVPEPSAAAILISGLCLSLSSFRRRQHWPASECRR